MELFGLESLLDRFADAHLTRQSHPQVEQTPLLGIFGGQAEGLNQFVEESPLVDFVDETGTEVDADEIVDHQVRGQVAVYQLQNHRKEARLEVGVGVAPAGEEQLTNQPDLLLGGFLVEGPLDDHLQELDGVLLAEQLHLLFLPVSHRHPQLERADGHRLSLGFLTASVEVGPYPSQLEGSLVIYHLLDVERVGKDGLGDRIQGDDQLRELAGSQGGQVGQTGYELAVVLQRLDGKLSARYLLGIL